MAAQARPLVFGAWLWLRRLLAGEREARGSLVVRIVSRPIAATVTLCQTWRRRYFELNGSDVRYYDKPQGSLKGEVDCAMVRHVT